MIVYELRNEKNGKSYIGQHSGYDLSKRWNRTLTNNGTNVHLGAAVKKYGADAFSRRILCYCSCQQELDLLEQFFILIFQTNNPKFGYNMTAGGALWFGGHTAETVQRIKDGLKRYWDNAPQAIRKRRSLLTLRAWQNRTRAERKAIAAKVSAGLTGKKGRPPWNTGRSDLVSPLKGKKIGPHKNPRRPDPPKTEAHRKHISEALKRYFIEHPKRGRPRNACCI